MEIEASGGKFNGLGQRIFQNPTFLTARLISYLFPKLIGRPSSSNERRQQIRAEVSITMQYHYQEKKDVPLQ